MIFLTFYSNESCHYSEYILKCYGELFDSSFRHVHTYTRTHVHTYTRTRVHTYTSTRVHTYTRTHVHTYTRPKCRAFQTSLKFRFLCRTAAALQHFCTRLFSLVLNIEIQSFARLTEYRIYNH